MDSLNCARTSDIWAKPIRFWPVDQKKCTLVVGAALLAVACGSGSSEHPITGADIVRLMRPSDIQGYCQDFQSELAVGEARSQVEGVFASGYKQTAIGPS